MNPIYCGIAVLSCLTCAVCVMNLRAFRKHARDMEEHARQHSPEHIWNLIELWWVSDRGEEFRAMNELIRTHGYDPKDPDA